MMDRLTEKKSGWNGHYMKCADQGWCDGKCGSCPELDRIVHRLAYYEDLEEQGRMVILPCKVGDTVYQLRHKQHAKGVGISPRIVSSACVWSDGSYALCHQGMTYCQSKDLGKTWFLSEEAAEKALRGEE